MGAQKNNILQLEYRVAIQRATSCDDNIGRRKKPPMSNLLPLEYRGPIRKALAPTGPYQEASAACETSVKVQADVKNKAGFSCNLTNEKLAQTFGRVFDRLDNLHKNRPVPLCKI